VTVPRVPEDALIAQMAATEIALRDAVFPRLIEAEVEDDGETYMALRCPRCDSLVEEGSLFAHGIGWTQEENQDVGDWQFDHGRVSFGQPDQADTSTLYYTHGDSPGHGVSLPEGWKEDWQ